MSFKGLLGKKVEVRKDEGPIKPKMPTLRDILEDIDNIKKNDPILTLAAIINKSNSSGRHSVVDSDIKELMDALQRRTRRESQSSSPNHPSHTYSNFKNAQQLKSEGGSDADLQIRKDDDNEGDNEEEDDETSRLTYDKLKHFLTTCEHSQELIGTLEGDLKKLQSEVAGHYIRQEEERRQTIKHSESEESNLL